MSVKVAINGFGRIGRNILRASIESNRKDIEVVAINDLGSPEMNAHLLKYDSVHGRFPLDLSIHKNYLKVNNVDIEITAERDPANLPWSEVDVALECTGIFTDKEKALKSMFHCLKPGGRLIVLEFSKPTSNLFSQIYDIYSFNLLPLMGKLIADDADSYQYLAESIRRHPDQETFKKMMQSAGFLDASYENLTGGIVALHKGTKT